jgi:histidinol-phosphate aminotransferase
VTWADYPNGLDYVRKMPNVMVMRTYSKIYGLAGLRLGYGIMSPERAKYVHRTRMPFNINALAQAAGVAALDDAEHVRKSRDQAIAGIRYLEEELKKLGVKVPPSYANFVFADLGRPAQPIYEALLRRGIITRPVPNYGFPNALRISVGLPAHNRKLVAALREILG